HTARPQLYTLSLHDALPISVGGTGKTPFVGWVARWFLDHDLAATIISRGYGGRGGRPNDEALELTARLSGVPHIQNPDRIVAARSEERRVGNERGWAARGEV